jgi:hypothetical protein
MYAEHRRRPVISKPQAADQILGQPSKIKEMEGFRA